jgi:outer membrane protein
MRAISLSTFVLLIRAVSPPKIFVFSAALVCAMPAFAQSPDADRQSSWGLGLGVANSQKPYAGIDRETKAVPLIQFENKYFRLQGLGGEVKLPSLVISDSQRLNFSLVGRGTMAGYEAGDAPILAGMAERKSGFWAGAKVEWRTSLVNVSADWTGDASGHSKGQKFSLGIAKPWRLGTQLILTPRIGATWQDRKYNDYYFGVRDAEALPGRPVYKADAGVNVEAGLTGIYLFDRHHSLMLGAGGNSLSKEIKNSPLVNRSTENRVFLGYSYRF